MLRSVPNLVATCTATLGLHSSSSTASSYSYFAFGSALRSLTARSAELRPPMPLAAVPPVNGPMNPTLTLSLAAAVAADAASTAAARMATVCLPISSSHHPADQNSLERLQQRDYAGNTGPSAAIRQTD